MDRFYISSVLRNPELAVQDGHVIIEARGKMATGKTILLETLSKALKEAGFEHVYFSKYPANDETLIVLDDIPQARRDGRLEYTSPPPLQAVLAKEIRVGGVLHSRK